MAMCHNAQIIETAPFKFQGPRVRAGRGWGLAASDHAVDVCYGALGAVGLAPSSPTPFMHQLSPGPPSPQEGRRGQV